MSEKRKWTPKEEKVLRSQVSKRPNNLQEAFRRTAVKVNRSPRSVAQHWYKKLKNEGACFLTLGEVTANPNRKNVHRNTTNNTIPSKEGNWWSNLLHILGLR